MELLILALAPSVALFVIFYLRDKYDREPWGLLLKTFGIGALVILPVAYIEGELFYEFGIDINVQNGMIVTLFSMLFLVALVEELAKFLVVKWYAWKKPAFNEPYDGIMYTVMASLGFATIENLLYVFQWGTTVAWLRAFLTVPMHALTAVVMGYYIGLAKYEKDKKKATKNLCVGLLMAVLIHGVFNTLVSAESMWLVGMAPLLVIYAWILGLRSSKKHAFNSPFKKAKEKLTKIGK